MKRRSKKDTRRMAVRVLILALADIVLINLASFLAYYADTHSVFAMLEKYGNAPQAIIWYNVIFTVLTLGLFALLKLYNSLWEYAGVRELVHIAIACAIITLLKYGTWYLQKWLNWGTDIEGYPYFSRTYALFSGLLLAAFTVGSRFSYRALRSFMARSSQQKKRTLLVGGGAAGAVALREFQTSEQSNNEVVCIVDDDFSKRGKYLFGVKIVGNRTDIPAIAERYEVSEIVLAIPTASPKDKREILELCQKTKCKLKTLPGIFQLANEEVSLKKIRDVDVLDLLGRDSVKVDLTEISAYLRGKTVLVTGGGGSIGSELCRQIAKNEPKELIILDIYENNAYEIQQELLRNNPDLNLTVRIASVRDADRVDALFDEFRPEIVFHAAAHKHVPLMEDSPNEAIKNNVFGTMNVAKAADKYHAERFVMISTDKAVNPTNIMGASKRICEMIVQDMSTHSATKFVAVRFGNVLGSNGSVIPLFKKQIAEGGPVTVTHRDIIRYFMTIPEAVSLVLQAGSFANQGEIFVLDMGDPVRIDDLARNMIRLSGFEPDVDIEIKYTGLRPGEKLYEEMLMKEEGLRTTDNELIHIGKPLEIDETSFRTQLEKLHEACERNDAEIFGIVEQVVPTYKRKVPV